MFKILLNPKKAKKHPLETIFIGFVYSSISILFATWIFPEYSSVAMIFLTVFSCLYLVQGAIKKEESNEKDYKQEKWLLKQHSKILGVFLFLFLGFTISFTFWTFILPSAKVSLIFNFQESIVNGIKHSITTGNATTFNTFYLILINNFKVLLISLIFALFYGAGAIYVLVWNASIMGFVIGNLAKNSLGLISLPVAFVKYLLHGIPEMIAYLTIALAGGLIYTATIKGDFTKQGRKKTLIKDALILIGISIIILILAGLIEVFISPFI